ncbi:unnamed protein product [Sphagnum balticum]
MMMHTRNGANSGGGQSSLGFLFGVDPPPPQPKKPDMGSSSLPMQFDHHIPQRIQPSYVRLVPVPDKKLLVKKNAFDCGMSKNHLNGRSSSSSSSGIKWTPKHCPVEKASDFLRHRPATKVHEVPGGPSSLGYIFGGK